MSALPLMLADQLRGLLRTKGLAIIILAALVPPLLTATWVWTHQDDVMPSSIVHDGGDLLEGDLVNITATISNNFDHDVGPFNATIEVGYFERTGSSQRFRAVESQEFEIAGLAAKATTQITMNWTAEPGTFIFQVRADVDDVLREIEENNNHRFQQVQVRFPPVNTPDVTAPNGTGQQVDLALVDMQFAPEEVYLNDDAEITITVANRGNETVNNASIGFEIYQAAFGGYGLFSADSQNVSLAAGEETMVVFDWRPTGIAEYALVAIASPPQNASEATPNDNVAIREMFVDRQFVYEEPEEKETAKAFYRNVLSVLHLKLLIPLLALWYAAGVIEDEREKGNLSYILSRPAGRWTLPLSRVLVSIFVLSLAVILGVIATYLLLLGSGQPTQGFLVGPIMVMVLGVIVYSGVFTLLGMGAGKPYLWGLLYILGLETVIAVGRQLIINDRPLLQDWVLNLSLSHHLASAFEAWDPKTGLALAGNEIAFAVLVAIGLAGILGATWIAGRREYDL